MLKSITCHYPVLDCGTWYCTVLQGVKWCHHDVVQCYRVTRVLQGVTWCYIVLYSNPVTLVTLANPVIQSP